MFKKSFALFLLSVSCYQNSAVMKIESKKDSLSFNLLSTNILDEKLYQELSKPPKSGMPWPQREKIWLQSLADEKQLAQADILCMQEFNADNQASAMKLLQAKQYQGYSTRNAAITSTWFKTTIFNPVNEKYYPFKTTGAQANGFAVTFLVPKNKKEPVIGIIDAHLNNNTPATTSYEQFRIDQIQEILHHINNPLISCKNWIICGDFNTDRTDPRFAKIMEPFVKAGFIDAHAHQKVTARSSQGHLKSIDYMWFKGPDLKLISTDIYPSFEELEKRLLMHRSSDSEGTFFSDHAILKARFILNL